MALKVTSLLVILFICLSRSSCSKDRIPISREEDLEFERQLKILNKPSVKTIQTREGDIIDCVDINKQPALDHPLLKNHKVQLRPSSFPAGHGKPRTSSGSKFLQLRSRREACPSGTVPIKRTLKEDLIRSRSLIQPTNLHYPGQHVADVETTTVGKTYYGATGYVSVCNMSLADDQSSSANMWIKNIGSGVHSELNDIIAGWKVSHSLNGDKLTRLFTYWTADGSNKTGCYNTRCPGFVQVDKEVTPDYPLAPSSTYGGVQYDTKLLIFQDRTSGNWWFVVSHKNIAVGYWPKEIFTHLANGATSVAWGGIARDGLNGISPPMGYGFMPNYYYKETIYFREVGFVNEYNDTIHPWENGADAFVDSPACYGILNGKTNRRGMGYSLYIGGPGGNNCGK